MPSFERAAEQIKKQAHEKQDNVREQMTKTDQGIEQLQQKANAIKSAIKNIKGAMAKLQAQAQQNPQLQNHPMYQQRMSAYREKLQEYQDALKKVESQTEMLRGRKQQMRVALMKIAGQASSQLAQVRRKQDAAKQQQSAQQQQQQQKKGKAKQEGGKVRG
jgi:chromosome segregation ATPase